MANETLDERLSRLAPFIDSTRYALTADDVRADYQSGKHRYAAEPNRYPDGTLNHRAEELRREHGASGWRAYVGRGYRAMVELRWSSDGSYQFDCDACRRSLLFDASRPMACGEHATKKTFDVGDYRAAFGRPKFTPSTPMEV